MSGIPKRLRQAMRLRARAYFKLRETCLVGGGPNVFLHAQRVADLNRYVQRREWRELGFDPIVMGC